MKHYFILCLIAIVLVSYKAKERLICYAEIGNIRCPEKFPFLFEDTITPYRYQFNIKDEQGSASVIVYDINTGKLVAKGNYQKGDSLINETVFSYDPTTEKTKEEQVSYYKPVKVGVWEYFGYGR